MLIMLSLCDDIYSVTTESGSEYRDAREDRCICPDHRHRDIRCKHQRRVAFAVDDSAVPSGVEEVDEQLGEHIEESPRMTATDSGEVIIGHSEKKSEAEYVYHVEPPE